MANFRQCFVDVRELSSYFAYASVANNSLRRSFLITVTRATLERTRAVADETAEAKLSASLAVVEQLR